MRGLLLIFVMLPALLIAQRADPYEVANLPKDTPPPGTVPQGVIKVRKPARYPYIKCEYYLTLAHVTEVEIEVPSPSGFGVERDKVPVFDSGFYSPANRRIHPTKLVNFSRLFVEKVQYAYPFSDTSSIDTMAVELWIGTNGKIRWRGVDTADGSTMPRQLELELYLAINEMTEWGQGGGFMTPKHFMRKQKRIAESYYCKLYIITSPNPITSQQKTTGSRWAPMDTPLNSPEGDENREIIPDSLRGRETDKKGGIKK